jgi:hypothetical protein
MKKTHGISIVITLAIALLPCPVGGQGYSNPARKKLRVVVLEGTPFERGLQHGKLLKKDIHALVELWKNDIEKKYKIEADVFIKKFLKYTDFHRAIKKWTPGLLEEVRGIADGTGLDFDTLFAFQLVDEMWVMGSEMMGKNQEGIEDHCTTIGIRKTRQQPGMVSQTLDIPVFYHGFQTLLHIKDKESGKQTLFFSFPGFIAANGLNSASVAVVVNAVQQLEHSRDGLPVAFVIRGILQKNTFKEAVDFIHSIKFGAPQNYMIGGLEGLGSFECSASHVEEFNPFSDALFTYHTNHPRVNMHFAPELEDYLKAQDIDPGDYTFKCPRFAALRDLFKYKDIRIDREMLKGIYRNRDTFINNRSTFGTTIMVLSENPELYISPGRPDEAPFHVFRFDGFHSIQH